jgi:hypothetical protein
MILIIIEQICLDETSIYLNMTLTYGRSKSGTRVIKKTNKYTYKRYNLLCAISADKVIGWKLYPERKGGVKTADILEFYDEFIHSKYKNYLVVIHKSKLIRETRQMSARLQSLPTIIVGQMDLSIFKFFCNFFTVSTNSFLNFSRNNGFS